MVTVMVMLAIMIRIALIVPQLVFSAFYCAKQLQKIEYDDDDDDSCGCDDHDGEVDDGYYEDDNFEGNGPS